MRRLLILLLILCASSALFAKTVKISTLDWPPFCGNKKGEAIASEIVKMAFEKMGYKVKLDVLPWARAVEKGKDGIYDAVDCMWGNEERSQWFTFSESAGIAVGFAVVVDLQKLWATLTVSTQTKA